MYTFKKRFAAKGFTLIELLVVIAIIGLLSSVVLASMSYVRASGRDSKRLSDLRQVQRALEMYYGDHGAYPSTGGSWYGGASQGGDECFGAHGYDEDGYIPGLVPDYISVLPEDPMPNIPAMHCYVYRSNGTDYMFLVFRTVESVNITSAHPLHRPLWSNEQSFAIFSPGARNW